MEKSPYGLDARPRAGAGEQQFDFDFYERVDQAPPESTSSAGVLSAQPRLAVEDHQYHKSTRERPITRRSAAATFNVAMQQSRKGSLSG